MPAYQPPQAIPSGTNQFIAPVIVTAAQAASQFQINLGQLPNTNTYFPFIKGVTIDNTANAVSGVSFVVSADGTGQTWTIAPGSWQVLRVAGSVTSLTITPISWVSGSVTFTLWNTTPPQDAIQFGTFTLDGTVDATITGPVTISALGGVNIANGFLIQQRQPADWWNNASFSVVAGTGGPQTLIAGIAGERLIMDSLKISLGLAVAFESTSSLILINGLGGLTINIYAFPGQSDYKTFFSQSGLSLGLGAVGDPITLSIPPNANFLKGTVDVIISAYTI